MQAWPQMRDKASAIVYGKYMYVFGGWCTFPLADPSLSHRFQTDVEYTRNGWTNTVYRLDLVALASEQRVCWELVADTGDVPRPRAAHMSFVIGDDMFVFGGRTLEARMNDLHRFDLLTHVWTRIDAGGEVPAPRSWSGSVLLDGRFLFIHGGLATGEEKAVMDNSYVLDCVSMEWKHVRLDGVGKRMWHQLEVVDNELFVIGGCKEYHNLDSGPQSTMLSCIYRVFSLQEICARKVASDADLLAEARETLPDAIKWRV